MEPKPETVAKAKALAKEVLDAIRKNVVEPLSARISALAKRQESADQLIADLDQRLAELEKSRSS